MTRYKAIIFDLDGTLCEYRIDSFHAFLQAFEVAQATDVLQNHSEVFNADNYRTQLNAIWREGEARFQEGDLNPFPYGASAENVVRLLAQAGIQESSLISRVQDGYLSTMVKHLHLSDGAERVIQTLGSRYQLGLLTNGPSQLQWGKIDRLKIRTWFDSIVVSDDIGIRKPDARIFKALLDQINVPAEQTVYVGDTLKYDVQGAHNAGVTSVWLNTHGLDLDEGFPKPHVEINRLDQLDVWLKRNDTL